MLVFGEVVTGHDDDAHDAAPIGTSEMQMKRARPWWPASAPCSADSRARFQGAGDTARDGRSQFAGKGLAEKAMAAQRRGRLNSAYSMVSLSMAEISGLVMTLAAWIGACRTPASGCRNPSCRSRRAGRLQHGEHQEEIALPEALVFTGTSMQAMEGGSHAYGPHHREQPGITHVVGEEDVEPRSPG